MSIFIPKTDDKYQKWIINNTVGFVANTYQIPSSRYMVLHTHRCRTINELASIAGEDAFTNNGYTKICSTSIQGLQNWLNENHLTFSKDCQKCNPRDPLVISEIVAKQIMSEFNKEKGNLYPREKLLKNREFIISQIRRGVAPEDAFKNATD